MVVMAWHKLITITFKDLLTTKKYTHKKEKKKRVISSHLEETTRLRHLTRSSNDPLLQIVSLFCSFGSLSEYNRNTQKRKM
jgi:hypothetical protein